MNKESLWFGFFEAGEKSTPVAHDPKLNTGNPQTLYLFNLKRNEIVEYKRDIAELKLRDLTKDENKIEKELKSAFNKAKRDFTPRSKAHAIPESAPAKPAPAKKQVEEELAEIDIGDDDDDDLFDEEDDS